MTTFVSALDLFSVGVGPSSSHTVGPMRAARAFVAHLEATGLLDRVDSVTCTLYGSLGATGLGHGTPNAVVAGLLGLRPETCDPDQVRGAWERLGDGAEVQLLGQRTIRLAASDIALEGRTRLPGHPNALTLTAWSESPSEAIASETYYSVGGGFIRREGDDLETAEGPAIPYPYTSAVELLEICAANGLSVAEVARANEVAAHGSEKLNAGLDAIWAAMSTCVSNGLSSSEPILPGILKVKRRAARLRERLDAYDRDEHLRDTSTEWLHAFALAVNEENAAGGRVVTAPTNGAAGIIPSVAHYYLKYQPGATVLGIRTFLLTAAAIAALVKRNASISGAEGGCQAEVGSACAMAAGALCAVLGGTPRQVENAAEIAMEHHLGLTCDPVAGLVQVPCIERNAIAASTAVSAARLALHGDGTHLVSLDTVIETMRQTGMDMLTIYKETSEGGLAVNVIEC